MEGLKFGIVFCDYFFFCHFKVSKRSSDGQLLKRLIFSDFDSHGGEFFCFQVHFFVEEELSGIKNVPLLFNLIMPFV